MRSRGEPPPAGGYPRDVIARLAALSLLPPLAGIFDFVTRDIHGQTWNYGLVVGIVALDSFLPIAPSETLVVAASVLAVHGSLMIWLIILCAWLGAVLGDNISYFLGATFGDWAAPKLFRGERGHRALEWAEQQIHRRPWVIIIGRFIPGGRTATTFASGWLDLSWRRFIAYDVVGGLLWSLENGMIGYLGGRAFQNSLWKAFVVAAAIAVVVALSFELGRRVYERRHPSSSATS